MKSERKEVTRSEKGMARYKHTHTRTKKNKKRTPLSVFAVFLGLDCKYVSLNSETSDI